MTAALFNFKWLLIEWASKGVKYCSTNNNHLTILFGYLVTQKSSHGITQTIPQTYHRGSVYFYWSRKTWFKCLRIYLTLVLFDSAYSTEYNSTSTLIIEWLTKWKLFINLIFMSIKIPIIFRNPWWFNYKPLPLI